MDAGSTRPSESEEESLFPPGTDWSFLFKEGSEFLVGGESNLTKGPILAIERESIQEKKGICCARGRYEVN